MPKKLMARFPVSSNALVQPGTPLYASHFSPGQFIDVKGKSSRRGFQGVMKRHGFKGGKMVKCIGLQIIRINYKYNVIYVNGSGIPGEPGEMIKIFDSKVTKKQL